jgi:membrane dipeptidase
LIIDLHLDVLLDAALRRARGERDVLRRRHLQPLRDGGVRVQVMPAYADPELRAESPWDAICQQLDTARLEEEESDGAFRIVTTMTELDEAVGHGAIAAVLALEGADGLEDDPARLVEVHQRGVRMIGLTWNDANAFADGVGEDRGRGLTSQGERLLTGMEELRIALDLSHLAPLACHEAFDRFGGTVLASHANAYSEMRSPRNLRDDVLAELGARDGAVGLVAIPAFTGTGAYAERLARHHAQIAAVAGPGAPAFGADFCDFFGPSQDGPLLPDEPTAEDRALATSPEPPREAFYAAVCDEVRRAAGDDAVTALQSKNALRVLRRVLV